MVKLVYHTVALGPINLDYGKALVRVGSSEDNDLVLLHPSVKAHDCLLVFRDETLTVLPPEFPVAADTDLRAFKDEIYQKGDTLNIGALAFQVGHSNNTVSLPPPGPAGAPPVNDARAFSDPHRYYCGHCRSFIAPAEVKKLGLVGQSKRAFCPKCSHPVALGPGAAKGGSSRPAKRNRS